MGLSGRRLLPFASDGNAFARRSERARLRARGPVRSACGARPCGPGALRCSLREGGCEDAAFAAERGKDTDVFSPVRRRAADCPSLRCAARRRNSLPDPHTRSLARGSAALEGFVFASGLSR